MHKLNTFHSKPNIAVVGSSGGIGAALFTILDSVPNSRVLGFSRSATSHSTDSNNALLDYSSEASIASAAELASTNGPLDLVIVATGILHDGALQPEKSLRDIDATNMQRVMQVNAIGPALVAKHFLPHMRRDNKSVFAAISARVGSISDNRLGGWASYRASKAALNMLLKTLSIEHARRWPEAVIAALHPGTVNTHLSEPFSSRVPQGKLFSPADSASYMLSVIDTLQPSDSGGFFAWDGQTIEY